MEKAVTLNKSKTKLKMAADFLMTVLLLCLMAYQITGQALHEWFGVGMLILFITHNVFNRRWYGNLLNGKYRLLRIVQTIINFAVLVSMLCLGFSGIVMSRHVFAFLPISGGMATARVMHLAASYWGFVLMSLHLGLHWSMILRMARNLSGGKTSALLIWIFKVFAVAIAAYGAVCFYQADIISYLFLKVEFVFVEEGKNVALIFIEYFAMMSLWICSSYYMSKVLGKGFVTAKRKQQDKGQEKS